MNELQKIHRRYLAAQRKKAEARDQAYRRYYILDRWNILDPTV